MWQTQQENSWRYIHMEVWTEKKVRSIVEVLTKISTLDWTTHWKKCVQLRNEILSQLELSRLRLHLLQLVHLLPPSSQFFFHCLHWHSGTHREIWRLYSCLFSSTFFTDIVILSLFFPLPLLYSAILLLLPSLLFSPFLFSPFPSHLFYMSSLSQSPLTVHSCLTCWRRQDEAAQCGTSAVWDSLSHTPTCSIQNLSRMNILLSIINFCCKNILLLKWHQGFQLFARYVIGMSIFLGNLQSTHRSFIAPGFTMGVCGVFWGCFTYLNVWLHNIRLYRGVWFWRYSSFCGTL